MLDYIIFQLIHFFFFFRFPRDQINVSIWAKFCGIDVNNVRTSHRLCSKHFHPRYLRRSTEKNRYILLKHAIPCYLYPETENRYWFHYYLKKKRVICLIGSNRRYFILHFTDLLGKRMIKFSTRAKIRNVATFVVQTEAKMYHIFRTFLFSCIRFVRIFEESQF